MTPPPTSAEKFPRRGKKISTLWKIGREALRTARALLPRIRHPSAWLQLVRPPNLLTIPGDILAGFLLSPLATTTGGDWAQLLLAIPAGLCFYAAGLIGNDLFDYAEDLRERPERPLPSGRVYRENAAAVMLVLFWIAVFLAAFFDALLIAIPLMLSIILYDIGLKRIPLLGPLLMGACRAGNFLLGAAAACEGHCPGLIQISVALALYVAAITHLARRETQPGTRWPPATIGRLLRGLLALQTVLCLAAIHRYPANLTGLLLLPLWPLHRRLAARFPPS